MLCRSYPDPENADERKEIVVKLCTYVRSCQLVVHYRYLLTNTASVSQDPGNYQDAPTEGIRRVLESVTGEKIPRGQKLPTDKIGESSHIVHIFI